MESLRRISLVGLAAVFAAGCGSILAVDEPGPALPPRADDGGVAPDGAAPTDAAASDALVDAFAAVPSCAPSVFCDGFDDPTTPLARWKQPLVSGIGVRKDKSVSPPASLGMTWQLGSEAPSLEALMPPLPKHFEVVVSFSLDVQPLANVAVVRLALPGGEIVAGFGDDANLLLKAGAAVPSVTVAAPAGGKFTRWTVRAYVMDGLPTVDLAIDGSTVLSVPVSFDVTADAVSLVLGFAQLGAQTPLEVRTAWFDEVRVDVK